MLGNTPLHLSAEKGHSNVVEYLLGQGADFCIQNKAGIDDYSLTGIIFLLLVKNIIVFQEM